MMRRALLAKEASTLYYCCTTARIAHLVPAHVQYRDSFGIHTGMLIRLEIYVVAFDMAAQEVVILRNDARIQ